MPRYKLIGYIGIYAITDCFLGWANIFLEGRVGIRPGSDQHFIVTFSIFSLCRSTSFCTAAAVSSTALSLL